MYIYKINLNRESEFSSTDHQGVSHRPTTKEKTQFSKDCIKWFEEYDKNDRCSFIKYDIREFYPSITERELDRALDLAKECIVIPIDKVEIIKDCRKKLLYYEDSIWIKKGEGGNFDTTIGAYDGAEICELVGCALL